MIRVHRRLGLIPALALAAVVLLPHASRAEVPAFQVPKPIVRKLDNGLIVGVVHDTRLPLVHIQLSVDAGSALERPDQLGAAYVVSQLVGLTTASRDARALNIDLDRSGASISAQAGRDFAVLSETALSSRLNEALELLSDVTSRSLFTDDDFIRVRRVVRARAGRASGPAAAGERALWASVFESHPYGSSPYGTQASLDSLTIGRVRDFYFERWRPRGAVLSIAGDVDPDSAFAAAQRWFAEWDDRKASTGPAFATPPARRTARIVDWPDAEQTEVFVGVPGPASGSADEVPIAMAIELLKREAGSFDGLLAQQQSLQHGGLVWLAARAPHDSAAAVAARLEAALLGLSSATDLAAPIDTLKRVIRQTFPMRFERLDDVAAQWGAQVSLGFGWDQLAAFPSKVDAQTPATITAAASRWFDPARIAVVAVGPAERLRTQIQETAPKVAATTTPAAAGAAAAAAEPTSAELKRGRDIVAKAVSAHGGANKLKGIRTSLTEADATLNISDHEVGARLEEIRQEPNRMQMMTRVGALGTRQVLDGQTAWSVSLDSARVVRDASPDQVDALQESYRSDVPHVLLGAAASGSRAAFRGTGTVDGQAVEKVEVWEASGTHRTLSFDAKTHYLKALEQVETDPDAGSTTMRREFGDYRAVNGVRMPFTEERWVGDRKVMDLRYARIELNGTLPAGAFDRPEAPLPPTTR